VIRSDANKATQLEKQQKKHKLLKLLPKLALARIMQ
jgi:hypothetical protein